MDRANWTCQCGSVEVKVPTTGCRIICYCEACRGFVERLGKDDRLDAAGGSDLIQVTPHQVEIVQGAECLRYLKMTERGPMRWYASCCDTPMANTLPFRAIAFASFQVHDMVPKERLPDVTARVHRKGALAHVDGPAGSVWPLVTGLLSRTVKSWVTGNWRLHPFFHTDGTPIGLRKDRGSPTG